MPKFEPLPDMLGNVLEVGDLVATLTPYHRVLSIAKVTKFSAKQVSLTVVQSPLKHIVGDSISQRPNNLVRITDDPMALLALLS